MASVDTSRPWKEFSFVAFDTETSGAYPLAEDIVEYGAVKWQAGQITDEFQTLLKPRIPMSDFIIGIHGITNEMVSQAPLMSEKIGEIVAFMEGSVLMAHHAPFDLGFMTVEFEKNYLPLPEGPVLCTSLLARQLIKESPDHRLQTLVKMLHLPQGVIHRALDDAKACLQVGLECLSRLGEGVSLEEAIKKMNKPIEWNRYRLLSHNQEKYRMIIDALYQRSNLDIIYQAGTAKGKRRRVTPVGLVRNPDGDYVVAVCHLDQTQKRFYLDKISDIDAVF